VAALVLAAAGGTAFVLSRQVSAVPASSAAAPAVINGRHTGPVQCPPIGLLTAPCTAAGRATTTGAPPSGGTPVLAVIGASFAAGVGAHSPSQAWPADLGRSLHWQVRVSADPGAGYISAGAGHRGPLTVLANRLNLAQLRPAVVLIQGGHNDIGQPIARITQNVRNLLDQIHFQTPGTRVGIVTVFATGDHPSHAALVTDQAIVNAARQADPHVMVFDPLTEHWQFPRTRDNLHPTTAGHQLIAARLLADLRAAGITATGVTAATGPGTVARISPHAVPKV
jgi:lysophospholipase L1-like esterase